MTQLANIPRWQVLLLLVGFPALYLLNSFTPWSMRVFVQGRNDSAAAFWISAMVLHWASIVTLLVILWRGGATLWDIGYKLRFNGTLIYAVVVFAVGGVLMLLHGSPESPAEGGQGWSAMYPQTTAQRSLWIFVSFSAGLCEELLYRGFAIRVLRARGFKSWQSVLLSSTAFVFLHGVGGVILFPVYFVAGLLFAMVFLWSGRLAPGIYLHALVDLMVLLAA